MNSDDSEAAIKLQKTIMTRTGYHRRQVGLGAFAAAVAAASGVRGQPPQDAVDVRSFGAVGDGLNDDTAALARAHRSGRPLLYPKTVGFFRTTQTLDVRADVHGRGGEIRTHGDGSHGGALFRVWADPPGLTISGLVLDGEYEEGTAGEWSHAIDCRSARGLKIRNNVIRRPYGDCVYLGVDSALTPCRDILIENNMLLHPRRCAVAVISADRVRIVGNDIASRHGYVAAIDLEPDLDGADRVHEVAIVANRFDVVGKFVMATVGAYEPTTGLVVARNRGRAGVFTWISASAGLNGGQIEDNDFVSNTPGTGAFLWAEAANNLTVERNRDHTTCEPAGYGSLRLAHARSVTLRDNEFCEHK